MADIFLMTVLKVIKVLGRRVVLILLWPLIFIAKKKLLRRKREFILENLRTSIPGKSPQFYETVMEESLQHSIETILSHLAGDVELTSHSRSVIDDIIHSDEKGAVVITTHHGDWEGVFRFFGSLPNCSAGNFYNRPSNKAADRFIRRMRNCEQFACGERNTPKVIERFKSMDGKGGFFAIVAIDLRVKQGIGVDFLNRETLFAGGSLKIAAESNVPIVVATSLVRNGVTEIDFTRIEYDPEKLKESKEYTRCILQKVMRIHSDAITANPEQWLFWPQDLWKKSRKRVS